MDKAMGNREQTILVVSDDSALCAAARREFEANITGLRVASVTRVAAARRILKEDAPAVILLEEAAVAPETDGPRVFFFSSRRRHTRFDCDWSSDVCSSDLRRVAIEVGGALLE